MCASGWRQGMYWKPGPVLPESPACHAGAGRRYGPPSAASPCILRQTVYSFKAFYAAIRDYSDLASQYAMSCRIGQTCFLTFINGAFALLIPAALLLSSGRDVRTVLVNFIFYALFAPACGQMINRIMYMSEAVMEADEAVGRLDDILGQEPME